MSETQFYTQCQILVSVESSDHLSFLWEPKSNDKNGYFRSTFSSTLCLGYQKKGINQGSLGGLLSGRASCGRLIFLFLAPLIQR